MKDKLAEHFKSKLNINKIMLEISDEHLCVYSSKNTPDKSLYIYVFANRRLINNRQSPLEVEVWKWDEKELNIVKPRQYVRELVVDHDGKPNFYDVFLAQNQKINKDGQ